MCSTWTCSTARPSSTSSPMCPTPTPSRIPAVAGSTGTGQQRGDPGRSFTRSSFSAGAEAQLQWIAAHTALPLRERIVNTLMLGPQPHPYRRIRRDRDGSLVLAVQDWRVDFSVEDQQVTVHGIRSGYNATAARARPARAGRSGRAAPGLYRGATGRDGGDRAGYFLPKSNRASSSSGASCPARSTFPRSSPTGRP